MIPPKNTASDYEREMHVFEAGPKIKAWFFDVHSRCPVWARKWEKALSTLRSSGVVTYRGHSLLMDQNRVFSQTKDGVKNYLGVIGESETKTKNTYEKAFLWCHQDTLALISNMPRALDYPNRASFSYIKKILPLFYPHDVEWGKAVLEYVGNEERKLKSNKKTNTEFLPRLLSERKAALVLVRGESGAWTTREGVELNVVLQRGNAWRAQMIEVMTKIPSLCRIEIPFSLDFQEATTIAQEISQVLNGKHPLIKEVRKEGHKWNLAFRRIQGMGFNGCFDVATQTIVVDPRHLESMKHEFCHWLLGHEVNARNKKLSICENEVHTLENEIF